MKSIKGSNSTAGFQQRLSLALTIWLVWQGIWHLAFEYVIRYPEHPIALLVAVKLATELIFYAWLALWLYREQGLNRLLKTVLLAVVLMVFSLTLRQWLIN